MDTTGNSPGLKPGECESILDITRTAIANGHVDLVQRQFNKLVDRVIDLSTRIIEATSSAMEDREVTFVRHVDPLICPSGMLARASSTTHPREGSSSRGSSVRSSVGHLGKPRGSLVSNGAFGRREWSLPLSDNGSGNGNKNSVLKRRLSTVSKDGSVGSSQRRMSIGADLRRRSSVSHLARRETYSTDEFGISHNTCPGRLQSSATGIGVCSEERHDGPPPVTEEELTDEEVKATLAVLEEGHPSLQTYYELLHVHSCKDALHCVTEAHTKGALIISSQAKPENVRDVQEEPQEHSLSNFSVCFVSALFSHYSDRCGKSQGASFDNHRETTVKLESAEENSLGGSKGGSTEEAGNIFICTNAFFQKQPSPGKQTARPLTHLVREVTTTPKESLNSSESSVDGKGNPSEKNGGPTNFVPVEWHPARSAELALRNDSIVMPRTNERRDVIKVSNECGSEWCTNGDSTPGGNAFVVNCTASTYALFTGLPLLSSSGISGSGADANCCIAATETAVPMAAVESSLEGGDSSASTTHTGKSGVLGCETARELSGSRLTIELRITKSPSLQR
ncbi:hypothetical protein Tb927.5.3370 [Trypanosoma brucei brucei TREU927]|uniref:T. brucei spp.-specific protein n=1 Tax=Trypanosoma brucei brucei (strain 927/4 GUTat10.1) TaxID=185431 RepID=Q57Z56_TRYB2|nr:hypothetical protein Tb927.5.3370 [Trypanosoma brucei brucei TREU927]AAX79575.1 hypothetical protein Tb927.5.3370 [Trypanosoma brucei]AAZ11450.1 hypothetical protein Tb927.5.3370 [Trypanosoma brucei brucei TREU927]